LIQDIRINLKAARYNSELSLDKYCEALGVKRDTIYNWESGRSRPSVDNLRKISELSGVPMDFIFLPTYRK
jgi:transcriptional regulator with XRE-family HTH domain